MKQKPAKKNPVTLTTKEAADILGVVPSRVRQMVGMEMITLKGYSGRSAILCGRSVEKLANARRKLRVCSGQRGKKS